MPKNPFDFDDWLLKLKEHGLNYFIEGGQAVNLWALRYLDDIPALEQYLPFNSKDCDIWVDYKTLQKISDILDGRLIKSESPIDGQIGIFTSYDDPDKKMDLLSGVFGILPSEIEKVCRRVYSLGDYRVIDPLYLFKGKCHNYLHLPQSGRNDKKHVAMLVLVMPRHIAMLLDFAQDDSSALTARQLVKEIKFLMSFAKDSSVRETLKDFGLTMKDLLPIQELEDSKLEQVAKFAKLSLGKQK